MSTAQLGRRAFLRSSAAAGVMLGTLGPAGAHSRAWVRDLRRDPNPIARNTIFMVADGMSIGTLTLADMFVQRQSGRPTTWPRLWTRSGVRRGMCATFAANALVTDSAAAASAWSIGERVNNGAISWTPDGRQPAPILVRARERGLATGLVTTTRLTHATPAAFIANVAARSQEAAIAQQIVERGVDVALGGGARYFDVEMLAAHQNVRVVRNRDELLAFRPTADGRLLGLFNDEHMSYELDRPESEPTLAEMTREALRHLEPRATGFMVQIEGGRVDHAAHNNDAAGMIRDQIAFDDALAVALDFTSARDDTLLIVTTDHGTANPGLTIYGREGIRRFSRLVDVKQSFEWISRQARRITTAAAMGELVGHATGITLAESELEMLMRLRDGVQVHPFDPSNSFYPVLGSLLANHLGVAFASPNHTSDFVEVTAIGPGSELLRPMIDNTDLHTLLSRVAALPPVARD